MEIYFLAKIKQANEQSKLGNMGIEAFSPSMPSKGRVKILSPRKYGGINGWAAKASPPCSCILFIVSRGESFLGIISLMLYASM